ncbi:MAG: hypothetical protein AB3N28_08240 [Kordiimonas sp.]
MYILFDLQCFEKNVLAEEFIFAHQPGDNYFHQILEAAIEAADGTHTVTKHYFTFDIPQSRILRSLEDNANSPINVHFSGHSIEREKSLLQIDVPLTRGLYGYRMFIIRAEDQQKFEGISTLSSLTQKITVGSGTSWPDTKILKDAGFTVKTGSRSDLWVLLGRKRFTGFPRSIYEIYTDIANPPAHLASTPLAIERSIMLHYPFDLFFYLAPNDTLRGDILKQGLERIYNNGKFMEIFLESPSAQEALHDIEKFRPQIFRIQNTLSTERLEAIPERYWHSFDN